MSSTMSTPSGVSPSHTADLALDDLIERYKESRAALTRLERSLDEHQAAVIEAERSLGRALNEGYPRAAYPHAGRVYIATAGDEVTEYPMAF